jgi:hypothetical protein
MAPPTPALTGSLRRAATLLMVACLLTWLAVGCGFAPLGFRESAPGRGALVVAVEPEPTSPPTDLAVVVPPPGPADPAPAPAIQPTSPPAVEPTSAPTSQAAGERSVATAPASAAPAASTEAATFSAQRAMKHLEYLADTIGSRVAGGPGVGLAAEYLATQFESAGLTVERQTFQFSSFADRGSSLEVLAPAPASLASTTLTHSGAGAVEAELVEVGLARPGDFDPADVRGRVALALRGEIRFSEKAANLAQAGASGLVIANNQPGSYAGSLGGQVSLPVVGVSQADGEQLRRQIANGPTRVRLAVDADSAERTGVNVQGSRPGGSQMVIIGAHYDSVSAGPGANDNASGTATMLELARVVAARQYPFTVRFVGFDAEEIGSLGAPATSVSSTRRPARPRWP